MSQQLCDKCLQYEDDCLCHADIHEIANERDQLRAKVERYEKALKYIQSAECGDCCEHVATEALTHEPLEAEEVK